MCPNSSTIFLFSPTLRPESQRSSRASRLASASSARPSAVMHGAGTQKLIWRLWLRGGRHELRRRRGGRGANCRNCGHGPHIWSTRCGIGAPILPLYLHACKMLLRCALAPQTDLNSIHTPSNHKSASRRVSNSPSVFCCCREGVVDKLKAALADKVGREERMVARDKQVGETQKPYRFF